MVSIVADFSGFEAAETSVLVSHYGIIEGTALKNYLFVQSLVLLFIAIIFFDACNQILKAWRDWKEGSLHVYALVEPWIDLSCGALVMAYIILMFKEKIASADETARILDAFDSIPWSDPSVDLNNKMVKFFQTVEALMERIDMENLNNMLCNIILLTSLLRVRFYDFHHSEFQSPPLFLTL